MAWLAVRLMRLMRRETSMAIVDVPAQQLVKVSYAATCKADESCTM